MGLTTHVESGSKINGGFDPVNILEIGKNGQPTEVIIWNGKLYVTSAAGETLIDGGIITTHAILADTITATQLNVTNIADIATVIAGTMYLGNGSTISGTITMSLADTHGDCYIAAGKTDFDNTQNGFILGIDDSDSNKAKFYIGDTTAYLNWTGSALTLVGATLTAGTIQTAASGERMAMYIEGTGSPVLRGFDSSDKIRVQLTYDMLQFWYNDAVKGTIAYSNANSALYIAPAGGDLRLEPESGKVIKHTQDIVPSADNAKSLGASGSRYVNIHTGTIVNTGANLILEADGHNIVTGVSIGPDANASHHCGFSDNCWAEVYTISVIAEGDHLYLSAGSGKDTYVNNSFHPLANNSHSCGSNSVAWSNVYSYNFIDKCLWLDGEDDIKLIKSMSPLKDKDGKVVLDQKTGKPKLDNRTLPDWIQVDSKAKDDNEPFRNMGHTVDLLLGAIRQLDDKIAQLENTIAQKSK